VGRFILLLGRGWWLLVCALASLASAQVTVTGRVVDEHEAPIDRARVTVHRNQETPVEVYTGPTGTFQVHLSAIGDYLLNADRTGYFELRDRPLHVEATPTEVTVTLNTQREVFQSVTVGAAPSQVDPQQTEHQERLSGTEVNDIPYPASHSLRNAMKLMPGVIQDTTGAVHFHGGQENQTRYTLDGFDITDPISGRYSTRLAVEGVRSLDLDASRQSAQNGLGSAGTMRIETENGTDHFHYTATNFIPGVDTQGGLHLGDWTPRAGISGPILKGKAWFSDSFDGEYNSGYISGLPAGQNRNASWAAGNLLHAQVNLTPATILFGEWLADFDRQSHYGLGVLDPSPTTSRLRNHQWLGAIKALHSWSDGALLEVGFGWHEVMHDRLPQGTAPYVVAPSGRSGNYFVRSYERGRRDQLFVNFYPRALHHAGRHQLQIGADAQRLDYSATFHRTTYELVGLSGLPLFQTTFTGSGILARPNAVVASYITDHWQPFNRLAVEAGVRQDWDELVRQVALAPRVSASFAPFGGAGTKITGGYAIVHDATNLSLFSRPLDQEAVTVPYSPTGQPGAPLVTTFIPGHNLKLPRSSQWSAGVEHAFAHRLAAKAEWLRKRGSDGFVYASENGTAPVSVQPVLLSYGFGGAYALTNQRRDLYDEIALTVRQNFGDQYGWMASYVRSRTASNAVLDPSVDQPLQVLNNFGRMPWDAPNRLLGWGYFPLPLENWAVSFLADYRTGFPFAITNDAGVVVGPVDSHRYPSNFDFNLAIERRFTFAGYRLAIRAGGNNLTGHRNPTSVNSVVGAAQFLQFFGDEGRHFVFRIRVFGRAPK
jgi:hypothetical protein